MKVTRNGVFETNSSSTHSISIISGDYIPDILPTEGMPSLRYHVIHPGRFGWEVVTYNDAVIKASYCLTYLKTVSNSLEQEQMLMDVIRETTGVFCVDFEQDLDPSYPWGYIDHQSSHVCGEAFASKQSLKDFIFNPKSYLHTDNDNHD